MSPDISKHPLKGTTYFEPEWWPSKNCYCLLTPALGLLFLWMENSLRNVDGAGRCGAFEKSWYREFQHTWFWILFLPGNACVNLNNLLNLFGFIFLLVNHDLKKNNSPHFNEAFWGEVVYVYWFAHSRFSMNKQQQLLWSYHSARSCVWGRT